MITVIDLETTGIDPEKDAIVEIAALDFTPERAITNRREHLVCPPFSVPPDASAVHHLIDEDLAGAPPLRDVLEHYQGSCVYVSHQAEFERAFLKDLVGLSRQTQQPASWICTYRCALRVWPEAPAHNNNTLRYMLGHANPFGIDRRTLVAHRALSDVIVTAAVFLEILKRATWSQMQMWSNEPPLETVIRFGNKHKHKRYDEVARIDPDYLVWVRDKSDLKEGTKFSAGHWLEQAA